MKNDFPAAAEDLEEPAWFRDAIAQSGESRFVEVEGARIHYLAWDGNTDNPAKPVKPVLLFLHGFRAHAHWWDFIAPFFTDRYRVLAMDFSGMGDSDRRSSYDVETFSNDLIGLIDKLGIGPVTAVGHSYGGSRLLRACAMRPDLFRRAVVVDSYVVFSGEEGPSLPKKLVGMRSYPDLEQACARFRLMPEQPTALPFLVRHIARHGARQHDDGWRWKFDPDMPATGFREAAGEMMLACITTPIDYIRGEHSAVVSHDRARRILQCLSHGRGPVEIPHGQHHLMLDQPIALISTLRALLADDPSGRQAAVRALQG